MAIITVHKPIETFFIASSFFLIIFLFFGGIFYMANLALNLATGIAMFLGWLAFTGVWISSIIPPIRWIDSDSEISRCNCNSSMYPAANAPSI